VPDLALNASADHDGYLICSRSSCVDGFRRSDGTLNIIGGTSAAAPTFAGVVALLVRQTNQPQGNVNPILYGLAATAPNAFHDITMGDNMVPCTQGSKDCPGSGMIGFSAGPGYDLTTGLGSVDVGALAAAWNGPTNPDFLLSAQSASLTLTRGTPATDVVTMTGLAGYSMGANLTCTVSATLTNTTCLINPATINPNGTATLTVTANSLSATLRGNPFLRPAWEMANGLLFAAGFLLTRSSRRRSRLGKFSRSRALLGCFAVCLLAATVSCGGGGGNSNPPQSSPPAPQGGTITVQGTSGSLNHSVQITVTVN